MRKKSNLSDESYTISQVNTDESGNDLQLTKYLIVLDFTWHNISILEQELQSVNRIHLLPNININHFALGETQSRQAECFPLIIQIV